MRTALLVTLLALAPTSAWARAGGGSNYHASPSRSYSPPSRSYSSPSYSSPSHVSYGSPSYGGGSYVHIGPSYGSSYGSSSGPGWIGWFLAFVLLLVIIVVVFNAIQQASSHNQTRAVMEEMTGPPERALDDILADVRQQDPAFDPAAFLDKVRTMFSTVQEAWFIRQFDGARAFMSDGVLRRFLTQQRLMEVEGVRNAIADMRILDARLVDVAVTPFFQVLDVTIDASARDADVPAQLSDEQARARAKSKAAERFTEVWTFARRPGATTKPGFSLTEGKCPNCGAPYPGGPTAQCEFCQAIVNSGQHDWVLCEITQAEEHRPARPVSDFRDMLAKDPEFNPYAVEDRASLVFWKLCAARAAEETAGLASVVEPSYREEVLGKIEQRKSRGQRLSFHEAAVGAVELIHLEVTDASSDAEAVDHAHVRVNWSARQAVVAIGEHGKPSAVVSSRSTVLTLARSAAAQTPPARGMATARCGNCGAAPTHDDADRCDSCGAELGAKGSDWVLIAETPYEAWQAGQFASAPSAGHAIPAFAYPSERRRLVHTMAAMARADGLVSPKERGLLLACADRWHVPRPEVEAVLDRSAGVELDLPERGSPASEAFLEGLISMALADGRIDRGEERLLQTVSTHLAIPPQRLQGMITEARSIPL